MAAVDTSQGQAFWAPGLLQNMPNCLQRDPMIVLHPASIPPEPVKNPWLRKAPYCIRAILLTKKHRGQNIDISEASRLTRYPSSNVAVTLQPMRICGVLESGNVV